MLAAVPSCAGQCRFVRGFGVGPAGATELWGFCGADSDGGHEKFSISLEPAISYQTDRAGRRMPPASRSFIWRLGMRSLAGYQD
jgi:hypothetical protein